MDLRSGRNLDEEKSLKLESARKKAEEKKLSRWEALGYQSLNVKDAISPTDNDITSATGSVHFVYGDCTAPSNVCSSEPAIIFRVYGKDHCDHLARCGCVLHYGLGKAQAAKLQLFAEAESVEWVEYNNERLRFAVSEKQNQRGSDLGLRIAVMENELRERGLDLVTSSHSKALPLHHSPTT
ncbi:Chromodomain-helicase-DNA-binding protein [Spatholobus suberectus]|nr:Chromodomain-helicase-DNA-binding protein [Spatholobus suberectus]